MHAKYDYQMIWVAFCCQKCTDWICRLSQSRRFVVLCEQKYAHFIYIQRNQSVQLVWKRNFIFGGLVCRNTSHDPIEMPIYSVLMVISMSNVGDLQSYSTHLSCIAEVTNIQSIVKFYRDPTAKIIDGIDYTHCSNLSQNLSVLMPWTSNHNTKLK